MQIAYVVHVETEGEHNRIMNQRKRIPNNVHFLTDYNSHYHYIRTIPGMQYDAIVVDKDSEIEKSGFEYLLTRLRGENKLMLSLNSFHKNMLKEILEERLKEILWGRMGCAPVNNMPFMARERRIGRMKTMCEATGIDSEFLNQYM